MNQRRADSQTANFMRLYSQHERRVYAYILALVGNLHDADEVVQETCLRLWEQFDQYQTGADFGAWACTIAHYQVLTLRKKRSTAKLEFGDAFYAAIQQQFDAAAAELDDRQQALNDCVQKLDRRNRELLYRCYSGRDSIQDVAKQRGRSVSALYSTLFRLRKLLHECVETTLSQEERS